MDDFTPIPESLARRTDLTAAQKLVYAEIFRLQNNPKITEIWSGYGWIAERVGMTERAVGRAVKGLVERGLLIVQKRAGRTHRWHANGPTAGLTDDDASSVSRQGEDDTSSVHTKTSAPPRTIRPRTEDDTSDDESINESISKRVDQKNSLSDSEAESRRRVAVGVIERAFASGVKTMRIDERGVIHVWPQGAIDADVDAAIKANVKEVADWIKAIGGTVVATPGTAAAPGSGTTG